ncbi:T9SS type A sorting domain-containing protein [Rosettibacter firmus]|uniref:T9SS type A sorting domain-containing protein n=1 Tax=Rosettibacter firmus TaxID=3111522 RepID=UPI00336BB365
MITFCLEINYFSNPFNSNTIIEFELAVISNVKLELYDVLGRKLRTIISNELQAGRHQFRFDAADLPSGIYFYVLSTNKFIESKKMMLIK